jgi:hypothetical protein
MKSLIALVALGCVAVCIVALATPKTAVQNRASFVVPKVQGPPDRSVPKKLRLYTKQDLTAGIGRSAWQQVETLSAAGAQAERLEMIRKKFPSYALSASSWTITFNKVSQMDDGVQVELEVIPTLIANRRPAAIGPGSIVETWVIKTNGDRTECRCHARGFDGGVGLEIF